MKLNISGLAAGTSLAGALFFALAMPVPQASAEAAAAGITDLSSQHDPRVSAAKRGAIPGTAGPRGGGGGGGGPPAGFRGPMVPRAGGGGGPPTGFRGAAGGPGPGFRGPMVPRAGGGVVSPGYRGPGVPRAGVGVVSPGYRGPVGPGFRGPVGPGYRGPAVGFRPSWGGGRAAFHRGPYRVRRGGLLLPFVGLGALGAIYVGSRAYTPYAFVEGPVGGECAGPTDDGICELRLTEVPLETGGAELQCVAYCPPQ